MAKSEFKWSDDYSVGVGVFDTHHKTLFGYINELHEIIHARETENKFEVILKKFIDYGKFHLHAEEQMFEKYDYPEAEEHIAEHKKYSEKVLSFKNKREGDNLDFAFDLLDFLEDWWIGHVTEVDKKYTAFFNKNGLS